MLIRISAVPMIELSLLTLQPHQNMAVIVPFHNLVAIHPKPMADFNFPLAVDCPPFPVQFTNNSMGTSLITTGISAMAIQALK